MPGEFNYCQRCGEGLEEKRIEGRMRHHCPSCGHVVFLDPKVAAVALVVDGKGLVMVKRGVDPQIGKWAFPSGYVDRGEVVEVAAVREVKEETGLDVALERLIGVYSLEGSTVVLVVYSAHIVGGEVAVGHDALDVKTFTLGELPPLPFPHDGQIMKDWEEHARTQDYLEEPLGKIQPIVQDLMATLLEIYPSLLDDADVHNLMDSDYCKNVLGIEISNHALLRKVEHGRMVSGHSRYYAKIYADKFYVCSQWWKANHLSNANSLYKFAQGIVEKKPNDLGIPVLKKHLKAFSDYIEQA